MQDQPTSRSSEPDPTQQAILTVLVESEERPWSLDEIAREFGDRVAATDAIAELHGAGLLHRCGEFVFATRAAVKAAKVLLG